jgi:hypothetical protein
MKNIALFIFSTFLISLQAELVVIQQVTTEEIESMTQTLINNDGVTIDNISYSGNETSAFGVFTGGLSAGLSIDEGIILSTGKVSDATQDNISSGTSTNLRQPGDSDLNSLIPGYNTYDATVLEFDFTTSSDSAYFNYAFASEEYTEYVNSSFNDVFGFFMDGENYALIPGTDEAVSINTVNHLENSDLFNNNDLYHSSANNQDFDITYDGFTDTFTAELTNLTPGETYHLKIAIADAGDRIYDSSVFLEAGSFSSSPVPPAGAPEPATWLLIILSGLFILHKKLNDKKAQPLTFA